VDLELDLEADLDRLELDLELDREWNIGCKPKLRIVLLDFNGLDRRGIAVLGGCGE